MGCLFGRSIGDSTREDVAPGAPAEIQPGKSLSAVTGVYRRFRESVFSAFLALTAINPVASCPVSGQCVHQQSVNPLREVLIKSRAAKLVDEPKAAFPFPFIPNKADLQTPTLGCLKIMHDKRGGASRRYWLMPIRGVNRTWHDPSVLSLPPPVTDVDRNVAGVEHLEHRSPSND